MRTQKCIACIKTKRQSQILIIKMLNYLGNIPDMFNR